MNAEKQLTFQIKLLKVYDTVESTYGELQRWAAEESSLPSGSCIDALYQTGGRGQRGNSWFATREKNLLPTFLLKNTSLLATEAVRISDWVALSVAEVVAQWAEGLTPEAFYRSPTSKVKVKWPNDIYWGDQKIAGILIAHTLQKDRIASSFCGIGLNVNEKNFPRVLPNPISLIEICGKELLLAEVRSSLFNALERNYLGAIVASDGGEAVHHRYEEKLYRRGEKATYLDVLQNRHFEGMIQGVSPEGRLLLRESAEGKLSSFAFKEIVYC